MEFEELKEYEYLDNSPDVHVQRHLQYMWQRSVLAGH